MFKKTFKLCFTKGVLTYPRHIVVTNKLHLNWHINMFIAFGVHEITIRWQFWHILAFIYWSRLQLFCQANIIYAGSKVS